MNLYGRPNDGVSNLVQPLAFGRKPKEFNTEATEKT
jgi:hypothetical protein